MPHIPYVSRPLPGSASSTRRARTPASERDARRSLQVSPKELSIFDYEGLGEDRLLELLGLASPDAARSVDASAASIRH